MHFFPLIVLNMLLNLEFVSKCALREMKFENCNQLVVLVKIKDLFG